MPTYPNPTNYKPPNFPAPLSRKEDYRASFPSDLLNGDKRKFYTQIEFVNYTFGLPSGSVKLPIPLKLDDNYVLHWSAVSALDPAKAALSSLSEKLLGGVATSALTLIAQGAGVLSGVAINPMMFMQFQRPEFRQFSLSWILTARNEKESQSIKDIITICKKAAAPTNMFPFMGYPNLAVIKMHPDDLFGHMVFKQCIITSVQANYTAGPTPAFFKKGPKSSKEGAPVVVTLTLNLQETKFWFRDEIT